MLAIFSMLFIPTDGVGVFDICFCDLSQVDFVLNWSCLFAFMFSRVALCDCIFHRTEITCYSLDVHINHSICYLDGIETGTIYHCRLESRFVDLGVAFSLFTIGLVPLLFLRHVAMYCLPLSHFPTFTTCAW